MSDKDSLAKVDKDLSEAVKFCLSSGLSSDQIARSAGSLFSLASGDRQDTSPGRSRPRPRSLAWIGLVVIALLAVVLACLLQNARTFNWMRVTGRQLQLKVLPYWDWTALYRAECIIPNPYMVEEQLTEEDCKDCEDLARVGLVHNVSVSEVSEDYLFDGLPFVVTDATQEWQAYQEFSSDYLRMLYTVHEDLKRQAVCDFAGEGTLSQIMSGQTQSFHSFWTNCKPQGVKAFRGFYKRPYFLPPMVESSFENFVAFSSGLPDSTESGEDDDFLECSTSGDLTWFAQIEGSYQIQLRPKAPCDTICNKLDLDLEKGQTLVVTNDMWTLWFARWTDQPSIAIGSMGNWHSS